MTTSSAAWLREVPLAHRGLHDADRPENSLAAFAAAASAGIGAELDVHLSADGVPVVVHDRDLERVTGIRGLVDAWTSVDLGRLDFTEGGVPTLAQALDVLGDAPAMVEVKNLDTRAGALEPAVAEVLAGHRGPTCVASFNPDTLRWFRRNAADVARVLTAGGIFDPRVPAVLRWSLDTLRFFRMVRPAAVSYWVGGLEHRAVQRIRRHSTVIAWTVASADDLDRARRLADNVIFEQLDVAAVRGG